MFIYLYFSLIYTIDTVPSDARFLRAFFDLALTLEISRFQLQIYKWQLAELHFYPLETEDMVILCSLVHHEGAAALGRSNDGDD